MVDLRTVRKEERGAALITVIGALLLVGTFVLLLSQLSLNEQRQSDFQEREDSTIAGTEALLERYAAKVTLDPLYYVHYVDEAERQRVCNDPAVDMTGYTGLPASAWNSECDDWSYVDVDLDADGNPDWYEHPLLDANGDPADLGTDDIAILMEVTPPQFDDPATPAVDEGAPLNVAVVGRMGDRINQRSISASIVATSLSEFVRVTELNLTYGSGANLTGKVYSGGNLDFVPVGTTTADIFAEGSILREPTLLNNARAFDGAGEHNDIRSEIEIPLNFSNFWDDLNVIQAAACGGGGICLDDADATGWLIHPYEDGLGEGRLSVYKATFSPSSQGCVNSEEWWYLNSEAEFTGQIADFNALWTPYGDYEYPRNGAVWTNAHTTIGARNQPEGTDISGDGLDDAVIKGSVTIYAGTQAAPKNVIINADTRIWNWPDSQFTIGLIASDEIVINPFATGGDRHFQLQAAILGQTDRWLVARDCGLGGSRLTPNNSTLDVFGSIATKSTGSISGSFTTRNYNFDPRLEYLRPPLYPLLDGNWRYENWSENPLPGWVNP